jgi:hypothetical protein
MVRHPASAYAPRSRSLTEQEDMLVFELLELYRREGDSDATLAKLQELRTLRAARHRDCRGVH